MATMFDSVKCDCANCLQIGVILWSCWLRYGKNVVNVTHVIISKSLRHIHLRWPFCCHRELCSCSRSKPHQQDHQKQSTSWRPMYLSHIRGKCLPRYLSTKDKSLSTITKIENSSVNRLMLATVRNWLTNKRNPVTPRRRWGTVGICKFYQRPINVIN